MKIKNASRKHVVYWEISNEEYNGFETLYPNHKYGIMFNGVKPKIKYFISKNYFIKRRVIYE